MQKQIYACLENIFLSVGKPALWNICVVLRNSFFKEDIKSVAHVISDSKWGKFKLIMTLYSSLYLGVWWTILSNSEFY